MKKSTGLALGLALLVGCATSFNRTTIQPDEAHVHHVIHHQLSANDAFTKTEVALATTYRNLQRVMVLRQPETHTFILKPIVSYFMFGTEVFANYTLTIKADEKTVTMDYQINPGDRYGEYPPVNKIPEIHADFRGISQEVATAIGGTISDN